MRYKGIVQKGEKRGAVLGFPTINVPLPDEKLEGIFAAKVYVDGRAYFAAAYSNTSRSVLEAHLLDFSGDLYGKEVEIELLEKIRDDQTFDTEEVLKETIGKDLKAVRQYFGL